MQSFQAPSICFSTIKYRNRIYGKSQKPSESLQYQGEYRWSFPRKAQIMVNIHAIEHRKEADKRSKANKIEKMEDKNHQKVPKIKLNLHIF